MNPGKDDLAARFRLALDLFETGEAIMRQNLRRRDPHASDTEIEFRLAAWLQGRLDTEQSQDLELHPGGSLR